MVSLPSLYIPVADVPQRDMSWLDGIAQAGGEVIGELGMRKSMRKLGDTLTTGPTPPVASGQPQGSFLSNLIGGNSQQSPAAPAAPVSRSAVPNQPPIPGIQRQASPMEGYRNAIASIESAGSGDYAAVGPRHPKLGRALGRYQVMEANIGPWSREVLGRSVTPEEFMANPQLQDAIFDGKFQQYVQKFGPEGAAQAWFGGEGGVGQLNRRDSLGTSIADYTNKFSNAVGASGGSVDAVNAMGAGGQVPGYVDPMVSAPNSRQQATAQPMPQGMPVNQTADASGNVLAPAVTPVQRGSISPDTIKQFLQDPNLRQIGVDLWKQNVQGPQAGEPWQFVTLPDGTLARANQQTGSVERIGNFAKPERGYSVLSPEERRALGIPETDTRVYQRAADGKIDAVGGAGQTINVGNEVEARRAAAAQAGLTEDDPAYQGFILTGKLPRESEQSLTATDKKAILEADEMVQSTQNVLPLIDRALQLNDEAYSGPTAGLRGTVGSVFGIDSAEATQELDNVVINSALSQLKAIFGGAPTEGERAILLDMSGASSQPAAVRKTVFERAKAAAQRRLEFYQQRANDMRGGTYYKPSEGAAQPAPAGAKAPAQIDGYTIQEVD